MAAWTVETKFYYVFGEFSLRLQTKELLHDYGFHLDFILSLAELVGQYKNILPAAFSVLTDRREVNAEKAKGNISLH